MFASCLTNCSTTPQITGNIIDVAAALFIQSDKNEVVSMKPSKSLKNRL